MAASSIPELTATINGITVADCLISLDVTNNNYFSPDTFRAEFALGRLPAQFNAAFWADAASTQIALAINGITLIRREVG
jgi:hypothetical protein